MKQFNFVENYNSLKKWEKDVSLSPRKENKQELANGLKNLNPQKVLVVIKNNKILTLAPLSVLGMTFFVFTASLIPKFNISLLGKKVKDFDSKYSKLEQVNNEIESKSNFLQKYMPTYEVKSPVLLFSYFLQISVPEDVFISDYSLDNKNFMINASSDNLDSINKFINLINELPLVMENTLSVKKLINNSNAQNNQNFQQIQNLGDINLEISGGLNIMSFDEKLELYKKTYNFGEVRKLEQFINLINTFKL